MKTLFTSCLPLTWGILLTLSFYEKATAQKLSNLRWPAGKVITTTGDTVRGAVTFYRDLETVRVQAANNQQWAFLPSQVKYFTGDANSKKQYFIPVSWERNHQGGGYKVLAFFELLAEGDVCLLKRTMHESYAEKQGSDIVRNELANIPKRVMQLSAPGLDMISGNNAAATDFYYLLDLADKLTLLPKPKEDLLLQLNDKYPELEAYIRKNNLSLKDDRGLTKLVNYYNQLKKDQ